MTAKVEAKKERKLQKKAAKKPKAASKKVVFKRAEKFVAEYRASSKNDVRLRRAAKAQQKFFAPEEPSVFVVIRILGSYGVTPKVRKIFQLLRLRSTNTAAFVKINKSTQAMLLQIAPYVTWGVPDRKTVSDLLYKRGYARINAERVPITSNALIEQHLGSVGVICLEDMVHQILTAGESFGAVNSFLHPFKLNAPIGGFNAKKLSCAEESDAGFRDNINELLRKMI